MRHWIDMHCDTLSELLVTEPGETVEKNHLCVDVERMRRRVCWQSFLPAL